MEQAGRQRKLGQPGQAQPRRGAQFNDQFADCLRLNQLNLHEAGGRRTGFGLSLPPTAECCVMEALLTGKGGRGQTAPFKRRQNLRALGGIGAPGATPGRTARLFISAVSITTARRRLGGRSFTAYYIPGKPQFFPTRS